MYDIIGLQNIKTTMWLLSNQGNEIKKIRKYHYQNLQSSCLSSCDLYICDQVNPR